MIVMILAQSLSVVMVGSKIGTGPFPVFVYGPSGVDFGSED